MIAWRSLHVYYYDQAKDDLLLDAVRPLFDEVAGRVVARYVVRHWRQGPHLRLNVRADRAAWQRSVLPRAAAQLGRYLREHPSTAALDPAAALARHRLLAAQEDERGPLLPWYPDNSVQQLPYDDRRHVFASAEAADLLADYHHDTTPLLFTMLDQVRGADGPVRDRLAMALLLTVAHTAPGPLDRGFVAFRSHAEGFLAVNADMADRSGADPHTYRRAFDAEYQTRAAELAALVGDVVDTLDSPADALDRPAGTGSRPVAFVRNWAELMAEYGRRARPLITTGRLVPPGPRWRLPAHGRSELHRLMFGSAGYQDAVFDSHDFHHYRVLLNYTYLFLTRLGITPLDRYRCCHLLANAVEARYGVTAVDLVRRYVRA